MIDLNNLRKWADDNQEYFNSDPEPDVVPQGMRIMQTDTSISFYDDDDDIYNISEECLWIS